MANWKMSEALSFDDVLLEPRYSEIRSRKETNLSVEMGRNMMITAPIVTSPMDTVVGVDMAVAVAKAGGLPIFHRYNTIKEQAEMLAEAKRRTHGMPVIGAAVGITGDYLKRIRALNQYKLDMVCLDVAHGHHTLMQEAIKKIKDEWGEEIHIMAGNVATLEGFNDLADWGADSIRCGIGGGSICSTRTQTGHGVPTFQTILDIAQTDRSALIVADGGIKNSGDMVKALAAGADLVMVGSLLAGTEQTPSEKVKVDGKVYKSYRGMASKEAQEDWRGKVSSIEGVASMVPYKGNVKHVLDELQVGIRSGLSYSGARTIGELQARAIFIKQTSAGQMESSTHIKRIA
tara:strand:+ start:389 stop:1426 length:1038 start_codon:yes stop_codon:yes gene_type:complete